MDSFPLLNTSFPSFSYRLIAFCNSAPENFSSVYKSMFTGATGPSIVTIAFNSEPSSTKTDPVKCSEEEEMRS